MSQQKEKEFVVEPAARRDKTKPTIYTKKRKGIPVPQGCTFQDLSKEQRDEFFNQEEQRWKKEYNKKKGTITAMPSLTRG